MQPIVKIGANTVWVMTIARIQSAAIENGPAEAGPSWFGVPLLR